MCGNLSFGVSRCFISYIGLSDYGDYEPLSAAQVALHFLDSDPRPDDQFLQMAYRVYRQTHPNHIKYHRDRRGGRLPRLSWWLQKSAMTYILWDNLALGEGALPGKP